MLNSRDVFDVIEPLINKVRQESFVKGYEATDAECVGLIVSKYFHWNGYEIGKVAIEALEDSNFHDIANRLQADLDKEFNYEESK